MLAALLLPCSVSAYPAEGPLQVKNQFPVFLPIYQPYLEQAAAESSFSVSLSHSSTFVVEDSANWSAQIDIELTELDFRYRKELANGTEVGVDAPVLRATAGFMDRPLAWYHRAFGFPDYGRHTRPRNEFLYEVTRGGQPVIEGDNDKAGFGDLRLTVKQPVFFGDSAVSLLGGVELPTGDAKAGYGSGSPDVCIALLADKKIGLEAKVYGDMGAVFPGDLKALQRVPLNTFYYAGAGFELPVLPRLNVLAELMIQTSPFPHTGIAQIDNTAALLVLGGRYHHGAGSIEFSLTEDLNTSGAPDFIMNLSWKMNY